jgi:hypothetical protein
LTAENIPHKTNGTGCDSSGATCTITAKQAGCPDLPPCSAYLGAFGDACECDKFPGQLLATVPALSSRGICGGCAAIAGEYVLHFTESTLCWRYCPCWVYTFPAGSPCRASTLFFSLLPTVNKVALVLTFCSSTGPFIYWEDAVSLPINCRTINLTLPNYGPGSVFTGATCGLPYLNRPPCNTVLPATVEVYP